MVLTPAAIGYTHPHDPGEPTTGKPRLSISDNEATILSALGAGRRCFEVGTGLGVSTRALARWAKLVVTEDPDPWVAQAIAPGLEALGNVECIHDREPYNLHHFDFVFIDGDHATETVLADIAFARTLGPRVIVLHDARYDNVARALDDSWLIIETEHQLAVGQ